MIRFQQLFEKHKETLDKAVQAVRSREFFAHWPEVPSGKIYGENANAEGQSAFQAQLNHPFSRLLQKGALLHHGEEDSPYGFSLGITYPVSTAETLITHAHAAQREWSALDVQDRAAVLIECLEQAAQHFFEIAYATQHTTGQGFVMSFQASGPHSFDRALESIATGYHQLASFAQQQTWVKPMGKMSVTIEKSFHVRPKGVNVTIGCSTFPLWNTVPGMFASLITGASTIAKAHSKVVYPVAVFVASMQRTFADLGLNPHIIQLGCGARQHRVTHELIHHKLTGTVDYTGSSSFGTEVEKICAQHNKTCFTEKAGVNCVILDSAANLDSALDNCAFSVSLYSGQMCTAPQNFYIPKSGVKDGDTVVSFDDVCRRFAAKIHDLAHNEKMGPTTLGALQSTQTSERLQAAATLDLKVLHASEPIAQPGHEKARTYSPLLLLADVKDHDIYGQEWFGPVSFVIPVESFEQAVRLVAESVQTHGALTTACYTTDPDKMNLAENVIIEAGAPVAFNYVGPIWINQSAAYSDFHGAGANPAGNATFADLSFISSRYNIIGTRVCTA